MLVSRDSAERPSPQVNYALIRTSRASGHDGAPPNQRRAALRSLGLTRFTSLFVTVRSDGTDKCLSSSAPRRAPRSRRARGYLARPVPKSIPFPLNCPARAQAWRNASARLPCASPRPPSLAIRRNTRERRRNVRSMSAGLSAAPAIASSRGAVTLVCGPPSRAQKNTHPPSRAFDRPRTRAPVVAHLHARVARSRFGHH